MMSVAPEVSPSGDEGGFWWCLASGQMFSTSLKQKVRFWHGDAERLVPARGQTHENISLVNLMPVAHQKSRKLAPRGGTDKVWGGIWVLLRDE